MHEELLVSLGKKKAQLVLKKVKYLNVFSKTIQVADIAIHNGTIVGVGEDYCGEKEIYFKNKILVPALIDSHIHICSTLVTPRNFMNVAAQHGVVTIINDPHEITNVLGEKGLNFFLADAKTAVGNVYFSLPSCVPVSKFDMSNAVFDANNMKKYINLPEVVSLGEMMNVFGTINYDSVIWNKLNLFKSHHKIIDGHAPLVTKKQLQAYRLSGPCNDHECTYFWEIKEHINAGFYVFLRDASSSVVSDDVMKEILKSKISLNRLAWCTDDKHLEDILSGGLVDQSIRRAIKLGFDPIDAICMGTINPATCFGFKHLGAIAAGHQASFIVLDQLSNFKINQVYVKGEPFKPAPSYTKSELNNHKQYYSKVKVNFDVLDKKLKSTKLDKPTDCIKIIPNTLLTKCLTVDKNTKFIVNKIVNIERHKFGNNIGTGFVCDFNIINGAIGTTIGHDSHNMIIIGSDNENIKLAAKALQKCSGGYVLVKNQQVLQSLSLPIGGLLSDLKPSEVMKNECLLHKSFSQIMKNDYKNPLLDMSFLSLTVIPEIRITPHGMIKSKI